MTDTRLIALVYLAVISLITVGVTVYDKLASGSARSRKHRVPEKTLLMLGILGGSAAELVTMLCIRHKTKHKKFMLGLPGILLLQAVCVSGVYLLLR